MNGVHGADPIAFAGLAAGIAAALWSLHNGRAGVAFALAGLVCAVVVTWLEVTPGAPIVLGASMELMALVIAFAVWTRAPH